MSKKMDITGTTKMYAVLGTPIAHSISPAMHNASFEALGIDAAYLAFDVGHHNFAATIDSLITLGTVGWNCTMPLKRLMYERVDELSEMAHLSGAVNTVTNRDGHLIGDNTDGYGLLQSMADAGFSSTGKRLVILGAGGAAAAVLAQAALDGAVSIHIFIRSTSSSKHAIQEEIERIHARCACRLTLCDLADETLLKKTIQESDILINASSVGMIPRTDASLIPDPSWLKPDLVVGDTIYEPRQTKLIKIAKAAGCSTFNGLYMLLHQGAKAFEIWTGQKMPVEYIRGLYFKQ